MDVAKHLGHDYPEYSKFETETKFKSKLGAVVKTLNCLLKT